MKKLTSLFVSMAAAAMALVSCQIVESVVDAPAEEAVTIRVHASANDLKSDDPATKTYIDNTNTIIWGEGEYMKLALTAGENTTFANSSADCADSFNGQASATFEFSVSPATAASYTYQGIYPASAASTSSNTNAANYKVNLPAIQNATATSYDPAAYIMVAKPETFNDVQTEWVASFRRATALNKITLKNFASSVEINKVKITAEGKTLAGGRHFNLTTGASDDIYGTDATIDVLYATPLTGTTMDVWFTSWGTEIAEGEKLTIVAFTTDKKSYTKEIIVPAGKSIKFQEGYLNTLGAKFDGITPENVTSLDGDYVILAKHNTSYYALKGEASTTRIASVDYTGSTTSFEGDASLVWTIATSGDGYTIKNGSNFIGWTSDSGNAADLVDENDYDATKCLMVIEKDGDVYHIKVSADQTRVLAKNTGSAYFAFYATTGQYSDIVLVPATALEVVATPTFNPAAGEVTSGTEVTISSATDGATIYYTTDGSDPTTASTQGTSVTITATTTIKAIAVKDGMANSEVASAQYTITGVTDYSVIETSNVTLAAGTNGSDATVNGEDAIKVGTSSKGGDMAVTVPAGTTKLHLHAAAWNGVSGLSLNISGATVSPTSIALTADSGIANNSPFTLAGNPADFYFELELSDITADTEITFTSSIAKRFVVWGVNAEAGASVTWNLDSIAITTEPTKTTYTEGQSFDPAGMVVTGHFVDADDDTNTKDEAVTGYTIYPDGALSTTDDHVTITYQGETTTQAITVNPAPAGNDGSLEHPYTVAEALAIIAGYSDKEKSDNQVYVSGIIANVGSYNSTYHSVTYDISDDGQNANTLNIYSGHFVANTNFSSNDQISVSDEVIVYGYLYLFGTTKEMYQNNYIYSLNGKIKALTAGSLTATPDNANKQITVTWGAATGTESAISYVVNCGTQSYNANAAGSHTFTMSDYGTYSVSVEATAYDAVAATINTSATLTDPSAGAPTLQYTLDGTDSTQGSNGYATNSEITQSSIGWIAVANTTINPWRFGGKNLSSVERAVYSTTAIASNISSIEVESGTATATVNSLTITVHNSAADAASGSNAIATKSVTSGITSSTVTLTKTDATSWAGKYYRIVYNVTCGGSNQYVQFNSAKFYGTN